MKMMSKLKQFAKVLLGRSAIVDIVPPIEFVGWKMATGTLPPWSNGGSNSLSIAFAKCDEDLAFNVLSRKVILTQFRQDSVNTEVAQLRWRHYIVYWSATVASLLAGNDKNFVEMGVCDGLTAWYASRARQNSNSDGEFFLYDSWEGMRSELLTESEGKSAGSYSYLNIDNTKKNLELCGPEKFVYIKGFIPESFSQSRHPDQIAWMHIDLNSSIPTLASLDYFWDRTMPGGIVLLDDFAWPGYEDTRLAVERWCENRSLLILQFPTGQAIITKQT
jgi:hypothetical protein